MPPKSPTSTPKLPPARVARAVERIRHHVGRLYQRPAPPPITVIDIIFGAFLSQAISASAQLGIADALAAGPLTNEELARRVGADPGSVARLMRLLISRGVFRRRRDGRFALNALADTLRTDSPISIRGLRCSTARRSIGRTGRGWPMRCAPESRTPQKCSERTSSTTSPKTRSGRRCSTTP